MKSNQPFISLSGSIYVLLMFVFYVKSHPSETPSFSGNIFLSYHYFLAHVSFANDKQEQSSTGSERTTTQMDSGVESSNSDNKR